MTAARPKSAFHLATPHSVSLPSVCSLPSLVRKGGIAIGRKSSHGTAADRSMLGRPAIGIHTLALDEAPCCRLRVGGLSRDSGGRPDPADRVEPPEVVGRVRRVAGGVVEWGAALLPGSLRSSPGGGIAVVGSAPHPPRRGRDRPVRRCEPGPTHRSASATTEERTTTCCSICVPERGPHQVSQCGPMWPAQPQRPRSALRPWCTASQAPEDCPKHALAFHNEARATSRKGGRFLPKLGRIRELARGRPTWGLCGPLRGGI